MLMAAHFQKADSAFDLNDFKCVSLCSELAVSAADAEGIIRVGFAELDDPARQMTNQVAGFNST